MDWNTHFTHMLDEATQMMYGGHLMGATEAMQRALMGPLSDVPTHTHVSTEVLDALLPDRNTLTARTGLAGLTGLTGPTGLGSAQDRSADAAASAPETEADLVCRLLLEKKHIVSHPTYYFHVRFGIQILFAIRLSCPSTRSRNTDHFRIL